MGASTSTKSHKTTDQPIGQLAQCLQEHLTSVLTEVFMKTNEEKLVENLRIYPILSQCGGNERDEGVCFQTWSWRRANISLADKTGGKKEDD